MGDSSSDLPISDGNHPSKIGGDREPFPDLLKLGGPEAFAAYRDAFAKTVLDRSPIVDPRNLVIVFDDDACEHVCFAQERFDKRRTQVENVGRVRDDWQQDRAEHISWIWLALTQPSEIVLNNQVSGNEVYLLGAPRNDHARPIARYYVSVRPIKGGQRLFKTAYPISQLKWDNARRGRPGTKHTLYRRASPRY